MLFITVIFFCFTAVHVAKCQSTTELILSQNDSEIYLIPETLIKVPEHSINTIVWYTTYPDAHHASYSVEDSFVSIISGFNETYNQSMLEGNETGKGIINVTAEFIGFNVINITIYDKDNNTLGTQILHMSVILSYERLNLIFTYILTILIFCVYVNMGATIDLEVVKGIVRRPVGPLVAIGCQYGFMPLIAYGLGKLFFPDDELRRLGIFMNGSSPGGGASNMWTLLLGGSVDLSIIMTFTSTVVAFASVPLWVLGMGPKIIGEDSSFSIPYDNIALIIVSLVVPCGVGILIQKFFPKVSKFMEERILKPFSLFNIIFIFTFGVYSHRYIFTLFTWRVLMAGFLLPGSGYLMGFIMATVTRRTKAEVIAISVEVGVQNANLAMIMLKVTLGQPAGDLAVVMPACAVIMGPLPLLAALIIKKVHARIAYSGSKDISAFEEPEKPKIDNGTITHIDIPDIKSIAADHHSNGSNGTSGTYGTNETSGTYGTNETYGTNGTVMKDKEDLEKDIRERKSNKLYGIDNPSVDITSETL